MNFQRAVAVLKTHARLHEFFSIPQITAGLQADNEKAQAMQRGTTQEKVVDWLRRTDPFTYQREPNLPALQTHFRDAAARVRETDAEPAAKDRILQMILAHGRTALREIGFNEADADELAREWAGLAKAEAPVEEAVKA